MEKIASNPVTSVAVMVFSALTTAKYLPTLPGTEDAWPAGFESAAGAYEHMTGLAPHRAMNFNTSEFRTGHPHAGPMLRKRWPLQQRHRIVDLIPKFAGRISEEATTMGPLGVREPLPIHCVVASKRWSSTLSRSSNTGGVPTPQPALLQFRDALQIRFQALRPDLPGTARSPWFTCRSMFFLCKDCSSQPP